MSLEQRPFASARVSMHMVGGIEVHGTLHLPPGLRTMDLLNRETEAFLAITGATVSRGELVERVPFIALNKAHILSLREIPETE